LSAVRFQILMDARVKRTIRGGSQRVRAARSVFWYHQDRGRSVTTRSADLEQFRATAVVTSPLFDATLDPPDGSKKPSEAGLKEPSGQGRRALLLSLVGLLMLLCAGQRIHADRSARVPVVIWEKSAGFLAIAAALVGCAAIALAVPDLRRSMSWLSPSWWTIVLAIWGALGFLLYLCACYET
jgi:hypothetical protein